jgi:hypothetical protein
MKELEEVIGSRPEAFCAALIADQPEWVKDCFSYFDTRFLFNTTLKAGANLAVEIGTASGFSTSVLCHALNFASKGGLIGSDFHVVSYDASPYCYFDASKRVGDATREQLPPDTEQNEFRKQSHFPLEDTIENFEEVAEALGGTKFEYCLEDEHMYRNEQWAVSHLKRRPTTTARTNLYTRSPTTELELVGGALEELARKS